MEFYNGEYSGLIEFSAAVVENPFGATLLELVEGQYDDIDTAVLDITETLQEKGYDADEEAVLGLMTGDILPEEGVVEILSQLGEVYDEEDNLDEATSDRNKAKLFNGAVAAYSLAEALLGLEDEELEDEELEDEEDEAEDVETEEAEEAEEKVVESAAFSRYVEAQNEMQDRMAHTDALNDLRDYAEELRANKHLTPKAFDLLFSRKAKDDYMNFSQAVEQTDYTAEEYLMCMDFALSMFDEMGPIPGADYNFSNIVDQDIQEGSYNFSGDTSVAAEEARDLLDLLHGVNKTESK